MGFQRTIMKQIRFGRRADGAPSTVRAPAAPAEDGPRMLVLIAAGLLTGVLVAAIECL